jgi:hypothetical protein
VSTARVDFTRGAAERIARAVRIVETGERDGNALSFKRPLMEGGGGKPLKYCTWDEKWSHNATAAITILPGTATSLATNPIIEVDAGEGWVTEGTSGMSLVAFNMTLLPGYDSTKTLLLSFKPGTGLSWMETAECP